MTNEPTRIVKAYLAKAAKASPLFVIVERQLDGRVLVSEAALLKMVEYLKQIHTASSLALTDPNTFSALATATDARNCLAVLFGDVQVERVSPGRPMKFPYRCRLVWQQRKDGLWNADCPCGASLCGSEPHMMLAHEALHFGDASLDAQRNKKTEKHERAFAPGNEAWLKAWFELSARNWEAHRTAPTYFEATKTSAEVLPLQDAMRRELFKNL